MLKIKLQIAEKILVGVKSINADAELTAQDIAGMLEYPPDVTMGDLAFPCFKLSKADSILPPLLLPPFFRR